MTWRRGGQGGKENCKIYENIETRQTVNPKRDKGGIDYIVEKTGQGGKGTDMKDEMCAERGRSSNEAGIMLKVDEGRSDEDANRS